MLPMVLARPAPSPRRAFAAVGQTSRPHCRRRPVIVAAADRGDNGKSALETTSDAAFLAKLVGVSFAGELWRRTEEKENTHPAETSLT